MFGTCGLSPGFKLHLMALRIPVGYWSVPLTSSDTNFSTSFAPYIPGAWPYLLRALDWATTYSLHVVVDLHGAPGKVFLYRAMFNMMST
jgi:aryl-phospho-beta-D-glucosidase BglC (GH1 family)